MSNGCRMKRTVAKHQLQHQYYLRCISVATSTVSLPQVFWLSPTPSPSSLCNRLDAVSFPPSGSAVVWLGARSDQSDKDATWIGDKISEMHTSYGHPFLFSITTYLDWCEVFLAEMSPATVAFREAAGDAAKNDGPPIFIEALRARFWHILTLSQARSDNEAFLEKEPTFPLGIEVITKWYTLSFLWLF